MSRTILCATLILVCGCSQSQFTINEWTGWPVDTRILCGTEKILRPHRNSLVLTDSTRVGLRCQKLTDGVFTAELRFIEGSRVTLQTRTTPYDDSLNADPGVVIDIDGSVTTVSTPSETRIVNTPLRSGAPFRIEIINHGNWLDIKVGCTQIERLDVKRPSTEWLIASVQDGSRVLLADPTFLPLYTLQL